MSSGDRSKSRSQFHRSLPNTFAANLEDLQTYSKQCITAMNSMCQASGHLAETFAALFHDTSLAEAALRMQEVTHDLGSRTQDASTQVEEDVTGMMNRVINKGSSEKSEEAVQTLARCFLLMLQTQYHFFQTAADLHAPLSRYQELEDLFIGEECQPEVRDACSSWMSAAQLTRSLRRGDSLTSDEVNLLETERGKSSQDDPKLMEARRKLESQSMIYKHEIAILPQTSFALLGGFHLHLQCLSMLLRSCCMPSEAQDIINRHGSSQLAAMAMGIGNQTTVGQTEPQVNQQEWFEAVCRELKTTTLQVDGTLCRQTSNVEEDFNIKMKTIKNLVKELATHLGLMVDVQSITAQIVSHACSSLAYLHSQTAVQLLFGRAYVVTARAAEVAEPYKRYAQVTSQEGAIVIEVPSVWDLVMVGGAGLQGVCPDVQDNNNTGSSQQTERQKQQQQSQSGLGACEVVYSAKIDLLDVVERRRISLPIIQVKLVKKDITITVTGPHTSMSSTSMTSTTQSDSLSSPCGMKRTIEKLVSKFRQRVPISKATPASSSPPSATTAHASRSAFYLPISQLEVQAAVVGGGVSPGNTSHTACSSLLSSPSISSGSSTMSSNSSLYERETPDSDGPKNIKMVPGEKVIKSDPKDYDGKSPMLGPMVTITSEPSPVDEKNHWETSIMRQHDLTRTKKGLASDSVLADLVNLLSGVRARSSSHLEPGTQGNRPFHDSVTRTSSSSSTSSQGGSGWGGRSDANDNGNRFGNYNPSFQEGDLIDRIQDQHSSMWPVKAFPHQAPPHQAQQDQVPLRRMSFDNNNEADFANYVAMNQLGKRSKRYGDNLNVAQQQHPGHSPQLSPRPIVKTQQQWSVGSVKEEGPMSKTWPSSDMGPERNENLNNTWSNPAHDSGSSSDEASNSGENPNTLLSMVHSSPAGSGLLTPVSRRRHSSGEDTLHGKPFCPSPEPIMHYLDVIPTDKTGTKTWPPKMVWQRPNSPQPPPLGTGAPPGGGAAGSLGSSTNQLWHHQSPSREHLNVHAPLTPQWSDPLSLRAPSVWAPSSTPVSPSGSMNTIATSSTATSHSQGASPNLSIRGHPKLDRRYAYTYH